jgi:hypothetical protein
MLGPYMGRTGATLGCRRWPQPAPYVTRFPSARVAVARKLGIRLWILLRDRTDYQEVCRRGQMRQKSGGARAGMPEVGHSPAMR